jgi:hypothetical protein
MTNQKPIFFYACISRPFPILASNNVSIFVFVMLMFSPKTLINKINTNPLVCILSVLISYHSLGPLWRCILKEAPTQRGPAGMQPPKNQNLKQHRFCGKIIRCDITCNIKHKLWIASPPSHTHTQRKFWDAPFLKWRWKAVATNHLVRPFWWLNAYVHAARFIIL